VDEKGLIMLDFINEYTYGWHLLIALCIIFTVPICFFIGEWRKPIVPNDDRLIDMPDNIESPEHFSQWIDSIDLDKPKRVDEVQGLKDFLEREISSGRLVVGDPTKSVIKGLKGSFGVKKRC